MTARPVLAMENVVGREVQVTSWSEVISNRIFSQYATAIASPSPEQVTTELEFKSGTRDSIVAAAA